MSDDEHIEWEEVETAAMKMFNVWVDGVLQWAKEAWAHLSAAGLTSTSSVVDTIAAKLRLVTLARIYQEFCRLAWDENPDMPVGYLAEDLGIDPVALGILAADANSNALMAFTDEDELREAALEAVTDSQRREIFECLITAYGGEVELYSRLWHTRSSSSEKDAEGDECDVTEANRSALDYVQNGFRSDRLQ